MRNSIILAGAAALAFSAPVLGQPGKGGGGPKGGDGGAAKVERGGGGGGPKAERGGGGGPKAERGGGGGGFKADRGGGQQRTERAESRGSERKAARQDRPQRAKQQEVREVRERSETKRVKARGSSETREVREVRARNKEQPARDTTIREARAGNQRFDRQSLRSEDRISYLRSPAFRTTGLVDGCPPGLAARNNGCLPPGQAKKLVGAAVPAALGGALLPALYRSWYPDDQRYLYRTDDGYIYRIDRERDLIEGFFPFEPDYTGAYYVGAAYPDDYLGYYNVPVQYQPYYADNDEYLYRYGDGSIYQVDQQDGLITAIVSLLAGDLSVGQPLPAGYDVYNVPTDYRDRYADSEDSWYRYNDGNIYQVDPTTRLVQAVVETLL
jgi:hypothetical protein